MKILLVAASIVLALTFAAPIAPAQASSFYHCYFRDQAAQGGAGTMYSSQVIESNTGASKISLDWQKYILATYPITRFANATCEAFSASTDQQQFSLSNEEKSWMASDLKIIHVNYTPGQAADSSPAASPTPVPSST